MLIVERLIAADGLAQVHAALEGAEFADGRNSALGAAREVKQNAEAAPDAATQAARQLIKQAIGANGRIASYARPVRWSPLLLSRYGPGDAYGEHVDAPFTRAADGGEMRADLSFTVFLDEPDSYEGGELVLDLPGGAQPVKLPAGSIVLYPTSLLHQVAQVRRGMRRAAVGWIESRVRSAEQRTILFDLEQSVLTLPQDATRRRLTLVFANLLKMWS